MFDKGDRVITPIGAGTVRFRIMKSPDYSEVLSYSVKLDYTDELLHVGSMFPAENVSKED